MAIPEEDLKFEFGAPWSVVIKWDEHPAFVRGLRRQQSTRGVDFLGLCGTQPYFIEVKDFRRYRIENKERLGSGELAEEVSSKVRDTLAGAVWACGRTEDDPSIGRVLRHVFGSQSKCRVVLWLEEDLPREPASRGSLEDQIKRHLRWLNPHVRVLCRTEPPLPGLVVSSAARRKMSS